MRFFAPVIALIVLASCSQQRYLQSAPPVLNPLFREKGEAFITAAYHSAAANEGSDADGSRHANSNGFALQGGYAFGQHFGFAASGAQLWEKDEFGFNAYGGPFDASSVRYNRFEYSLAGNYFFNAPGKKSGVNLMFGPMGGSLRLSDAGTTGGANYTRYFHAGNFGFFLQPCVNVYLRDQSAFGFSLRLNFGSFQNIKTDYSLSELQTLGLNYSGGYFSSEFGMKFRYGIPNSPVGVEAELNYMMNHSSGYFARKTNAMLGVSFRLDKSSHITK